MTRERFRAWASIYLALVTLSGSVVAFSSLSQLKPINQPLALGVLVLLAAATELYPLVSPFGSSSLISPILYAGVLLDGAHGAIWVAVLGVTMAQAALRRAPRAMVFNFAQYALAAATGSALVVWHGGSGLDPANIILFVSAYFLVTNVLSHTLILLRGSSLDGRWMRGLITTEVPTIALSILYGLAMQTLGRQGDQVNALGLFFFFLPLMAIGIILRQVLDGRRYAQQLLRLVQAVPSRPHGELGQALHGLVEELGRDGQAEYGALIRITGEEGALVVDWPSGNEALRKESLRLASRAQGRPSRLVHIRRQGPSLSMQSWLAVFDRQGEGGVALVVARQRSYAFFGNMARLLRTATAIVSAHIEREFLLDEQREAALAGERARVAQAIHDTLAQELVTLTYQAAVLTRTRPSTPAWHQTAEALEGSLRHATDQVREAILILQPTELRDGVWSALWDLSRTFGARGLQVAVDLPESTPVLAPETSELLWLAASEGVQNAWKHGEGDRAALGVTLSPDAIVVQVSNDRPCSDPPEGKPGGTGLGLFLLSERLRQAGGSLDLRHELQTSRLVAVIPWIGGVAP